MTPENQSIRGHLKSAENIIVSALAHQPEDDDRCLDHLIDAKRKVEMELCKIDLKISCDKGVKDALKNISKENSNAEELSDRVACWKCGELIDLEDAERFFSSGGCTEYLCKHCTAEEAF